VIEIDGEKNMPKFRVYDFCAVRRSTVLVPFRNTHRPILHSFPCLMICFWDVFRCLPSLSPLNSAKSMYVQ